MRIMLVSSLYPPEQVGGAEVLVAQLARDLVAAGHQVAVACLSREATGREEADGVTVYRMGHGPIFFPMDWGKKSRVDRALYKVTTQLGLKVLDALGEAIEDFSPEVVNTHSLAELSPRIWSLAAARKIPTVHTLHDFSGLCTNGAMFKDGRACEGQHPKCKVYGALHGIEGRHVDGVIGVGRDILARHLAAGQFSKTDVRRQAVIWNPVEAPPARPARILGDAPVFGFLGRIEGSKGADLLLEACRLLPPDGWRLKIAGRAVDGDAPYQRMAEGLPVDFLGFVDRDSFFEQIDCLIAPPLWPEAFGRTVAEAYLRGVPVIGADIAGVAEQVAAVAPQGLFKVGDAGSLADRMAAFIEDNAAFQPTPQAVEAFARRVSPDEVAKRYVDMYQMVVGGRELT